MWLGERAYALDGFPLMSGMWRVPAPLLWSVTPGLKLDVLGIARRLGEMQIAQRDARENMPAFTARLTVPKPQEETVLTRVAHPFASYLEFSPRLMDAQCRLFTQRRICATMLGLRLYTVDHQGTLPKTLDELVPAYLPSVPEDPFSPDRGPIRYKADPHRPVIYSVGSNGRDDGASEKPLKRHDAPPWDREDVVFSYFRDPPPATQPDGMPQPDVP